MTRPRTPAAATDTHTVVAFSIDAACKACGLSRSKVYELIRDGELAIAKIGRRSLIAADDLHNLVARHRLPPRRAG